MTAISCKLKFIEYAAKRPRKAIDQRSIQAREQGSSVPCGQRIQCTVFNTHTYIYIYIYIYVCVCVFVRIFF
jgi:hypothetical protein